jgi:ubiquinone/menaquinone biosynthesis C-methylase UbiE
MPFDDNTFDIISAKSLWYFVSRYDWDLVLKELFRILKPGGCIEMVISDFVILNGSRADQFYWGRVKEGTDRLGLEQTPSAVLPHYLYKAGFKDVTRALIALPRGWGGQMGHVTDLLALYYTESIIHTFANLSAEEMEQLASISKDSEEVFSANQMSLVYATKPEM